MKTFKDLKAFEKRVKKSTAWEDYFSLGGRMWNIYEYGGGWQKGEPCYVYFINKKSNDMILVRYHLPSTDYINGVRVTRGEYSLISVELLEGQELWR